MVELFYSYIAVKRWVNNILKKDIYIDINTLLSFSKNKFSEINICTYTISIYIENKIKTTHFVKYGKRDWSNTN